MNHTVTRTTLELSNSELMALYDTTNKPEVRDELRREIERRMQKKACACQMPGYIAQQQAYR